MHDDMKSPAVIALKARRIKLLLLDVDGVMTDGGLYYSAQGVEMKRFHAHDGYGVVRAHEHGLKIGIISGRTTPIVEARAKVLKIDEVFQNAMDKVSAMRDIQHRHALHDDELAFIGDELFDLPLLKIVGLSAAPPNAQPEVRRVVDYVTHKSGGEGAVRELIDLIIAHQKRGRSRGV
jgi:3-deoxy-D-manno-octulosonate 8-phosphate phosphatase (KDO 8-P phosphatase)